MGELVSIYSIDLAQTGKLRALQQQQGTAQETNVTEEQQSGLWAKIIAVLIFIIALLIMPTFAVDEDQYQNHSSTVSAQVKGAG